MGEHQNKLANQEIGFSTRREFLKKSSTVATGGVAATTALGVARAATKVDIAKAAHPAGDDVLKVALVGCGGRGTKAAVEAMRTKGKVKLWAMADAFSKRIEGSLKKMDRLLGRDGMGKSALSMGEAIDVPPERQFAGLDAYESAIDSGVDVVILATPPGFRPVQLQKAIEAGKHVFAEKPLAVDGPGVRKVLEAKKIAEEKGLAVGVGLQRHHENSYIDTVNRIRDGAIGEVILTRVYWNGSGVWVRTRADFQQTYGHEPTEMEYQVNNWYYFNWLCGDHIVEQHIHNIDVSNWIKGAYPLKANGMGGREIRTGKEFGQIFDHHAVEFTYPDGSTMLSQCRHQPGCWSQVSEFASGTQGKADLRGGKIFSDSGDWEYQGAKNDPYQQEHDNLFAAIRSGKPFNELEYGAFSTLSSIMGRMATYGGKVVTWDEALNSDLDYSLSKYDFAADPPVLPDENGFYPVPVPGRTKAV